MTVVGSDTHQSWRNRLGSSNSRGNSKDWIAANSRSPGEPWPKILFCMVIAYPIPGPIARWSKLKPTISRCPNTNEPFNLLRLQLPNISTMNDWIIGWWKILRDSSQASLVLRSAPKYLTWLNNSSKIPWIQLNEFIQFVHACSWAEGHWPKFVNPIANYSVFLGKVSSQFSREPEVQLTSGSLGLLWTGKTENSRLPIAMIGEHGLMIDRESIFELLWDMAAICVGQGWFLLFCCLE